MTIDKDKLEMLKSLVDEAQQLVEAIQENAVDLRDSLFSTISDLETAVEIANNILKDEIKGG